MEDSRYLNDFQIVSFAGDSRAKSMMALKKARQGHFQEAQELLEIAEEEMNKAHSLQFDMLQKEVKGQPVDITIVTIHGQDHLTMAMVTHDLVVEMIEILKNK